MSSLYLFPANFPEQCRWEGPIKNRYISGNDRKTISASSVEECKAMCEEECSFHCMSFDYISSSRTCYLQMVSRYTHVLSSHTSYDYYERNCFSEYFYLLPFLHKVALNYHHIPFNFEYVCSAQAFNGIKQTIKCNNKVPNIGLCFKCFPPKMCCSYLRDSDIIFYISDTYRLCDADSEADWNGPLYGKSLSGFANHKTINSITVEECKRACQQADTFHCRSFRWLRQNGNCYLSSYSRYSIN